MCVFQIGTCKSLLLPWTNCKHHLQPGVLCKEKISIYTFQQRNIHDIHKLRTSKGLLELIDFTDQPVHAKGSSLPTYPPQEYFVQSLSKFRNANQPNRMYSDNPQQMSWPATPVQALAQPSPSLVGFSSPHQVGYQPTAQYQPATKYQPGFSYNPQQSSLPATCI